MNIFIHKPLVNTKMKFVELLRKLKLGTFSQMKKVMFKQTARLFSLVDKVTFFGKIAFIQQSRKIDLEEVFWYTLGAVPWSLTSVTSGMVKQKSQLWCKTGEGYHTCWYNSKEICLRHWWNGTCSTVERFSWKHLEVFGNNYLWWF